MIQLNFLTLCCWELLCHVQCISSLFTGSLFGENRATARQMSPSPPPPPLRTSSRAPAAIESHYSIRVQLPRRQHSHTRGINDLVTYKFQ